MQSLKFIFLFITFLVAIDLSSSIVCYKCNSIALEACAMSLDTTELPYEDCKTSLNCIMSIVDSVTYRGCGSDTPTIGATYKKSCETNLCNKGIYPPGRLKCHHCAGTECMEKPVGKPNPCLSHHEEDDCYTHVISAESAARGCRSDTNRTVTDEQVEYCAINGCNDKPGIRKLKCAECDSKTDLGCKRDLQGLTAPHCNITQHNICEMDVILNKNETCFLYHNLERVVRGCTSSMPEEIKHDMEHRMECENNDLCNAACLEQQKCVVCDSTKNQDCRSNASNIPKNTCGSAEISSCYACENDDWQIKRDCGPKPQDDPGMLRCYECSPKDGCNETPFSRCYKCSTKDNANCANWERPGIDSFIDVEECEHPGASCIIAAFSDGRIERGCLSDNLSCNDTLVSCHQCDGSFCNRGRYPPERLRCFQCNGDKECEQLDEDPLPCINAAMGYPDACFEFYDAEGVGMIRGCRSDSEMYYRCIFYDDGKNCHVCYEDGCNNSPTLSKSNLICYHCEKSNQECQYEQFGEQNLKACSILAPFGHQTSCYITRHLDGTTSRGCKLDSDRNGNIFDQTLTCATDACNSPATFSRLGIIAENYV